MMRAKRAVIGVGIVGIPVALGGFAAVAGHQGPMMVDQQGLDFFNAAVDWKVVRYYDAVCQEVRQPQRVAERFTLTAQDVVGLDVEGAAGLWQERLGQAEAGFVRARDGLGEVNVSAPAKVDRPDGSDEDADYREALRPMLDVLDEGIGQVRQVAADPRWDAGDEDELGDVVGEAMRVVSAVPAQSSGVMQDVVEAARIFSPATRDAVQDASVCGELFGVRSVGEDVVVDDVVDARRRVMDAHEGFQASLAEVAALEGLDAADLGYARGRVIQAWQAVADAARAGHGELAGWENTRVKGTAQWDAVEAVAPLVGEAGGVFEQVAAWAEAQVAATEASEWSVEGLSGALNASVEELRDQQLAEARVVTKALTTMPIPNKATAEAMQQER